jgi:hypothetical protein
MTELFISIDDRLTLHSPKLQRVFNYWQRLATAGILPSRRQISPLELPPDTLANILLLDIEDGRRRRYRWRLIGTHVTEALGRDATGQYWDELYSAAVLPEMQKSVDWIIEHGRPLRSSGLARFAGKDHMLFESVEMPLSSDGSTVDMILMAADYTVTVSDLTEDAVFDILIAKQFWRLSG